MSEEYPDLNSYEVTNYRTRKCGRKVQSVFDCKQSDKPLSIEVTITANNLAELDKKERDFFNGAQTNMYKIIDLTNG